MDWDQISQNWDEMTRRIQPQSKPYTKRLSGGLLGGQASATMPAGDPTPTNEAAGRGDQNDEATAANTLA